MTWLKGLLTVVSLLAGVPDRRVFSVGTPMGRSQRQSGVGRPWQVTHARHARTRKLIVGDLHADSALWGKDLLRRNEWGQVDLPRLIEGGATLQMFTTVTKSPQGQNYEQNATDTADNITLLAMAQRWPAATLTAFLPGPCCKPIGCGKQRRKAPADPDHLSTELNQLLARRARGEAVVGALLGTEGSHALDGQLDNIDQLYDAGFRMMGLQHFFDNRLGGSLHGESQAGLTPFGEQAVRNMQKKGIMIDVAHSSEATVRDTFA